jgi:hypothetical protein
MQEPANIPLEVICHVLDKKPRDVSMFKKEKN